ncbi:putative short-chain dehydrogenase reductase sdr protein [Phaeoacremonium minimum UCRPA7]|uniref:Putative short-chain dehydrogenase reductase sdr protein n=1 Tax=Phaeoacremonium minimum (strain UCR-PA7) TaxID=1286976 RepID=R8BBQ7_PHAM7|nr:putative short-chain dehydrogenase reductase sdr protein [Phaeoacremonium minimum UCRPA7]EON96717.1 putative short-chain dehydrogenase reductase sdr protein [Phaeoacremonium minimum UCRPA7]
MTPPRAFDFSGDVAIVTGAGSRMDGEIGNGRAAAILLARHGAKVALVDFNTDWANETKRMIDEENGTSIVIQADVTDEESCKNAVAKTVQEWGAVHILVNIVGVGGAMGDATAINMEAWDRDFRINVTSMVLMSRHAIPEMRKARRGSIVNMSSVSGWMVYTPMTRGRGMTDEMRQARINQNLMKLEGTGWDVGYAILFLASKEARWITGLIMPVDGGTTAGRADRPALKADTLAENNVGIPN